MSRLLPVPTQSRTSWASDCVLADVVEVVGHDQREADLGREPEQLLVEPALVGHPVVLELEEEAVLAEDVAVLAGEVAASSQSSTSSALGISPDRQDDSPISPSLWRARCSRSIRGL